MKPIETQKDLVDAIGRIEAFLRLEIEVRKPGGENDYLQSARDALATATAAREFAQVMDKFRDVAAHNSAALPSLVAATQNPVKEKGI